MTLLEQWQDVLASLSVKHIDPTCEPHLEVRGSRTRPYLHLAVKRARNTLDQEGLRFERLAIASVKLHYWPGKALAQAWVAAGWACYLTHEALELVTADGVRPLDPHAPPNEYDRNLRTGLPTDLTPESLRTTLCFVMEPAAADRLIAGAAQ